MSIPTTLGKAVDMALVQFGPGRVNCAVCQNSLGTGAQAVAGMSPAQGATMPEAPDLVAFAKDLAKSISGGGQAL